MAEPQPTATRKTLAELRDLAEALVKGATVDARAVGHILRVALARIVESHEEFEQTVRIARAEAQAARARAEDVLHEVRQLFESVAAAAAADRAGEAGAKPPAVATPREVDAAPPSVPAEPRMENPAAAAAAEPAAVLPATEGVTPLRKAAKKEAAS